MDNNAHPRSGLRPPPPQGGDANGPAEPVPRRSLDVCAIAVPIVAAAALPWLLQWLSAEYYISLATRVLVYAIAATSLNLVLGYGGMVSFGHAAFFGLGAYVTAIAITEGVLSPLAHVGLVLGICGAAALAIGAVALRTRGVYFIMSTLAFAQMLYYVCNSIKGYGGDEGLNLKLRTELVGGLTLKDPTTLYLVALAVLALLLLALARFVPSRLGRAVVAMRDDLDRAEALGFATYRLQLVMFTAAGMLGGLAGLLHANAQGYVSPGLLHWTQSGTLMVMVILGGVGRLWGGVLGAAALLLLQEGVGLYTTHWEMAVGVVLLVCVLFARNGLAGIAQAWRERRAAGQA